MPEARALVVLGSSLTALAVVRHAHAHGLPCVLVDARAGVAAHSRLARIRILDDDSDDTVLACLSELAHGQSCALIADSDEWLRFILRCRETLDRVFVDVLHPRAEELRICLDKSVFIDWCTSQGFPTPRQFDSARAGEVKFPVLLRPASTRHGLRRDVPKAIQLHDAPALSRWLDIYRELGMTPTISESLVRPSMRQYSVGIARRRGYGIQSVIAEKVRTPIERCSGGTYVRLSPNARAEHLARRAVEALDYHGIAEVEVLHDDSTGESFLIEVNARPWVQYALASRSGHDLLGFVLDRRRPDEETVFTTGKRWLAFEADLFVCFARGDGLVRTGDLSFARYVRTLLSANVFAVWDIRDPLPFLLETRRILVGRWNA